VLGLHVKSVDVVEPTIVRLGDHRQSPRLEARATHLPLKNRVAHDTDAVRVGDGDRTLQDAALLEPRGAGHLPVAIEGEPGAKHGIATRTPARMHDGDPGAHWPPPDHELPGTRDESGVPHLDAGDIGDRIERPWHAADERVEAEVAGPGGLGG
jgi:hypothetical protein